MLWQEYQASRSVSTSPTTVFIVTSGAKEVSSWILPLIPAVLLVLWAKDDALAGADALLAPAILRALGEARRNDDVPQYCDACFTGDYPTALTDYDERGGKPAPLNATAACSECWRMPLAS